MKVDLAMLVTNPLEAKEFAIAVEAEHFSGVYTFEGRHDPLLPLAIASQHTQTLDLITAIAVAFGRSPLTLAHTAYDVHMMSKGRLILGLGTQVKAHIERRYSMPWSRPTARMREFVHALHAIWDCWQTGSPLAFEGEFYRHTLMMDTFSPGHNPFGVPKIYLAGVGAAMVRTAGEVGDGHIVHPFHTARYLLEQSLPALNQGLTAAGRDRKEFEISCQMIVGTGHTDDELSQAREAARRQIGFYASTPAYLPVLECMDRVDIHAPLLQMSKQGRWGEMGEMVDDELLHAVAGVGKPAQVVDHILESRGALIDRLSPVAYGPDIGNSAGAYRELCRLLSQYKPT